MECNEFEKLMPEFVQRKLDYRTLKAFYEHVESCPRCKEDLTIQILITEGMNRLEEGDAFDLQGELDKRLQEAQRKVKFHRGFQMIGVVAQILAMLAIIGFVAWIIF